MSACVATALWRKQQSAYSNQPVELELFLNFIVVDSEVIV